MGHALKHNQCLEELDLSYNRIPEQGAVDLASGIGANDQLRALKVRYLGSPNVLQIKTTCAIHLQCNAHYNDT